MLLRCAVSIPGTNTFVVALKEHEDCIRLDNHLTVGGVTFRPVRIDTDGSIKVHAIELERYEHGEFAHNGLQACRASATAIAGFFSLLEKQGWNVMNLGGFMEYHGLK